MAFWRPPGKYRLNVGLQLIFLWFLMGRQARLCGRITKDSQEAQDMNNTPTLEELADRLIGIPEPIFKGKT